MRSSPWSVEFARLLVLRKKQLEAHILPESGLKELYGSRLANYDGGNKFEQIKV